MRQLVAAALAGSALLLSGLAEAQNVDPAVRKAAEARAAARSAGDTDTYGRYTLDDAVITSSAGVVSTKAQRMAAIKAAKPVTTPRPRITDEKYRAFGDAVVRTWREDGSDADGQKVSQRWIEVWTKQKGRMEAGER